MYSLFANFFYALMDFLFPSKCIICEKNISFKQNYLCDTCLEDVVYLGEKCDVCSGIMEDNKCIICSDRAFYITRNFAMTEYSGVMKEILRQYKFNKRKRLYRLLCNLSYPQIVKFKDAFDIVTSVPMSRKKKWKRGFNQSELVAKELAKRMNKKYCSLLKERLRSKTQKKLGYRDRFLNILDRYKIRKTHSPGGRSVLLVDDVFTTGATINECARILKSSGAIDVYTLTLARVNYKRQDMM